MPRDRDDEDYDDRPRRPARRRPRDGDRPRRGTPRPDNTVNVLLVVGGVVVALALVCGGVAIYVYSSIARQIDATKNQMLADQAKLAAEQQRVANEEMSKSMAAARQAAVNSDKTKATEAVAAFMQEVKAKRPAAAYRMLSAEYRGRTTEADFAAFLAANATHFERPFPPQADPFAAETGSTFTFNVNPVARKRFTLVATKEGGKWVVDSLTVADR